MENTPKVNIEYLVDYELLFTNYSEKNQQSDISNLNIDTSYKGKKGFHLCGGSVDEQTGEVSGCVLDGTFTFYKDTSNSYKGFLGNCLSNNDYTFSTPQTITIKAKNDGCLIKSIFIYFDEVAGEYATDIYFSNAIKEDNTTDSRYTSAFKIKNNKLVFMYSFGEDSQIKQITINFHKWSKKTAFVKVLKIKTGYTGVYDYRQIRKLYWNDDKFSDENELTFGISSNGANVDIFDNDDMIAELYNKNLIFQNVQAKIYIDDIYQGSFFVDAKDNERGSDVWTFECIDYFERIKDDIVPMMQIQNNIPLTKVISWVLDRKGINYEYTDEAYQVCSTYLIPKAYIKSQQKLYDVLLKVCQVGLLRMYVSQVKFKITRGV